MRKLQMKMPLLGAAALAALSIAGSATAQSSVTFFGIVDTGFTWDRVPCPISSRCPLAAFSLPKWISQHRGSGRRHGRDLLARNGLQQRQRHGPGHEHQQPDHRGALAGTNGSQRFTFNRRSFVSLSGGWSEVRLGREYTPQFYNQTTFDPFGGNGVGATAGAARRQPAGDCSSIAWRSGRSEPASAGAGNWSLAASARLHSPLETLTSARH